MFIIEAGQIDRNKIVNLIHCQSHVHTAYNIIVRYHIQFCLRRSLFHRQQQKLLLLVNLDDTLSVTQMFNHERRIYGLACEDSTVVPNINTVSVLLIVRQKSFK